MSIQICADAELDAMEAAFNVVLPAVYRSFMLDADEKAYSALTGSDFDCKSLILLRPAAEELLRESNADFSLDRRDFVFAMHQGYTFLFFTCSDRSADPPVYRYIELEPGPTMVAGSFSEWVEQCRSGA